MGRTSFTAADYKRARKTGASGPPCTVTADFHVVLKRPTPSDALLTLRARAVQIRDDRAVVEATLQASGKVCATLRDPSLIPENAEAPENTGAHPCPFGTPSLIHENIVHMRGGDVNNVHVAEGEVN
jgi:hypothetical protein